MDGTKIKKAKVIGNNAVQQNSISWSYLNLGYEARIQINKNKIKEVFKPKDIGCNHIIISGEINPKLGIR